MQHGNNGKDIKAKENILSHIYGSLDTRRLWLVTTGVTATVEVPGAVKAAVIKVVVMSAAEQNR